MTDNTDSSINGNPYIGAISDEEEEPTFDAPWQARVFAISLALIEEDIYTRDQFNAEFIKAIQAAEDAMSDGDTETVYHRQWMESVENLLKTTNRVTEVEIEKRQTEFETGEREESEFVIRQLPEKECN